jgi:hypothetical protein
MPDGLKSVDSWVTADLCRSSCTLTTLLQRWVAEWCGLGPGIRRRSLSIGPPNKERSGRTHPFRPHKVAVGQVM